MEEDLKSSGKKFEIIVKRFFVTAQHTISGCRRNWSRIKNVCLSCLTYLLSKDIGRTGDANAFAPVIRSIMDNGCNIDP